MADDLIESILNEPRSFVPPKDFIDQANIDEEKANNLKKQAEENHIQYWATLAKDQLEWFHPFKNILDESKAPNYEWFNDGVINASYNSLDVNVSKNPNKTAIIFETEDGNLSTLHTKSFFQKPLNLLTD